MLEGLWRGKTIKGFESGQPVFYSAGDTAIHEFAHAFSDNMTHAFVGDAAKLGSLRAVTRNLPSWPRQAITSAGPIGSKGNISESFARIVDESMIISRRLKKGEIIPQQDWEIYQYGRDFLKEMNKSTGANVDLKFMTGNVKVRHNGKIFELDNTGKTLREIKVTTANAGPIAARPTTQAPPSIRAQRDIATITGGPQPAKPPTRAQRILTDVEAEATAQRHRIQQESIARMNKILKELNN